MTATQVRRATVTTTARTRLHRPDLRVEKELLRSGCTRLAAVDEVGRGALAGPVTVGVVVVTSTIGRVPAGLRDSKLLTSAARDRLVAPVRRWALEWAVGHASPAEIDAHGIMAGLRTAAWRALEQLSAPVDAVLLDGNHDYLNAPAQRALFDTATCGTDAARSQVVGTDGGWPGAEIPVTATAVPVEVPVTDTRPIPVHLRIKADLRCAGVAAASVLAKTTRDAMMIDYATGFPAYGWAVNKGYATPEHLAALAELGPCELHRRSWRLSGPSVAAAVGDDERGTRPRAGRGSATRA